MNAASPDPRQPDMQTDGPTRILDATEWTVHELGSRSTTPTLHSMAEGADDVLSAIQVLPASNTESRRLARQLLITNGVDDDRYGPLANDQAEPEADVEPGPDSVGVVLTRKGRPVCSVQGEPSRGRLQLDVLADPSAWPGLGGARPGSEPMKVAEALIQRCATPAQSDESIQLELWAKPEQPWHHELAHRMGMTSHRALYRLQRPLPLDDGGPSPAPTRDLRPDTDLDELLKVNNQAFAYHPDQGNQTRSDLAAAFSQPSFDPAAVRVLVDVNDHGRLAGFCWTKLHPPNLVRSQIMGEIYVIGVGPDHQGRGLGASLTAAGLHHLYRKGASMAMLYVEADNEPALGAYRKLGFTRVRTDRAWRRD